MIPASPIPKVPGITIWKPCSLASCLKAGLNDIQAIRCHMVARYSALVKRDLEGLSFWISRSEEIGLYITQGCKPFAHTGSGWADSMVISINHNRNYISLDCGGHGAFMCASTADRGGHATLRPFVCYKASRVGFQRQKAFFCW